MYTRHNLLTKRTRDDHVDFFMRIILQGLHRFFGMDEHADITDSMTKVSDGILLTIVLIDVGI